MDTSKPHPERFETYTMLPGGKAFTIKDSKFVFKLDRHGGWRDEYGHYYNQNGEPDFQPEDAELTPSEGSVASGGDFADEYDEFEPDYQEDDYEGHHQSMWEIKNMEKISKNLEILSDYPNGKALRVYFRNVPFKEQPKTVYEAYAKKFSGIVNIIFDLEDNRRTGEGHFIMSDAKKAEALIKTEGDRVLDRDIHYDVEIFDDLIMDPISEKEMVPFWDPFQQLKSSTNNDVPKFKAATIESVTQPQTQTKVEAKKQQIKVVEPPKKTQQKVEPAKKQEPVEPEFKNYLLNFQIFENRTKFFQWLDQNGGNRDKDLRNIVKNDTVTPTKITMDVNTSIVQKLNGQLYNGKQVKFTPTN